MKVATGVGDMTIGTVIMSSQGAEPTVRVTLKVVGVVIAAWFIVITPVVLLIVAPAPPEIVQVRGVPVVPEVLGVTVPTVSHTWEGIVNWALLVLVTVIVWVSVKVIPPHV